MKNVLFITNLKKSSRTMSSTDIMTRNILLGLSQNDCNLILLALYDDENEIQSINEGYSQYAKKVIYLPRFFNDQQSKYFFLFYGFFKQVCRGFYKEKLNTILKELDAPDLIISNKITLDEILYGKVIKNLFPKAKLYQYWSDPMTLAGITKKLLVKTPRRWPFWIVEKMAIADSDLVIYGTKTLLDTQQAMFKGDKGKMTYIDICYSPNDCNQYVTPNQDNRILYAGNYYSSIRNIMPLVQALSEQKGCYLDIYGNGDVDLSQYHNVCVHGRVSNDEISIIEKNYDLTICILNHTATQIPGKVFYETNSTKKIIVLADGPYQQEIEEYLTKYKRFVVCKNNADSIRSCLQSGNLEQKIDLEFVRNYFSPKAVALSLLNGGIDGNQYQ
jgi:hypothetical protein